MGFERLLIIQHANCKPGQRYYNSEMHVQRRSKTWSMNGWMPLMCCCRLGIESSGCKERHVGLITYRTVQFVHVSHARFPASKLQVRNESHFPLQTAQDTVSNRVNRAKCWISPLALDLVVQLAKWMLDYTNYYLSNCWYENLMINKFAIMVANGNYILNCAATGLTGFLVKHLFRCGDFLITSTWGLDIWGGKNG